MALAVVAAGLGLLGPGPLSRTRAATPDQTAIVEYERHARKSAETTLRVELLPQALGRDEVRLSLDQSYLDRMQLMRIVPAPVRSEVSSGEAHFVFASPEAGPGTFVNLTFQPERPGPVAGTLRIDRRSSISLRQVVFP